MQIDSFPEQGHNREIFLKGQSHFPWFFSLREMFFPVENFHFGNPPPKKKKSSLLILELWNFSFLPCPIFTIFLLFFYISPLFHFFFASFFPVGQQKFPAQKSLWGTLPPAPHLLCHCSRIRRWKGIPNINIFKVMHPFGLKSHVEVFSKRKDYIICWERNMNENLEMWGHVTYCKGFWDT